MSTSNDPLLQPYQLRHLTLRNRIMTTSHEPAYPEEGMPKARYRAYHVARAKGGVALTMTAGSAAVSRDSPPVFNNILVYKDEVVPWMKDLADACHEHGAAVMIQLTHLGRRTRWDKAFWLPVVSPSHHKEAAHRYDTILTPGYDLGLSLNGVYRSSVKMQLAPTLGAATVQQSSSYQILHFSAAVSHQSWRYTLYVTNLLDRQEILVPPVQPGADNDFNMLANDYVVNPPREIGVRVGYKF
jgi:hypothetical protein